MGTPNTLCTVHLGTGPGMLIVLSRKDTTGLKETKSLVRASFIQRFDVVSAQTNTTCTHTEHTHAQCTDSMGSLMPKPS